MNDTIKKFEMPMQSTATLMLSSCSTRLPLESLFDQAFITLTGFDEDEFKTILHIFAPIFDKCTPLNTNGSIIPLTTTKGQTRQVQPEDCVALVLAWTRTTGSMMNLQLIFGTTITNLSVYLHFDHHVIIHVLKLDP